MTELHVVCLSHPGGSWLFWLDRALVDELGFFIAVLYLVLSILRDNM